MTCVVEVITPELWERIKNEIGGSFKLTIERREISCGSDIIGTNRIIHAETGNYMCHSVPMVLGQPGRWFFYVMKGSTCIDSGGFDIYVMYWECLQDGAIATIQDSDGWGALVFDGWYINVTTVTATGENEWRMQGDNGKGILSQKCNHLHISTEGATGHVIVQNFFSQENFLNLTLSEYKPQV